MQDYVARLRTLVEEAVPALRALSSDAAEARARPDAWSAKELLGHLVDSASVNHERFVRAQQSDDLDLPGYGQDDWVRLQAYQDESFDELITLWASFNRHIAHVMERASDATRTKPRTKHALDRIAFHPVSTEEATTLDYLMRDYVVHLEHHLGQMPQG